jgi:transcriptional regulator with XRE-family HTH domain
MSQEELAHAADLDMANVSRYEAGQREPGVRIIARLARGLEVAPRELFVGLE